jgi:hypothetical protein
MAAPVAELVRRTGESEGCPVAAIPATGRTFWNGAAGWLAAGDISSMSSAPSTWPMTSSVGRMLR